jgi:hypothetical protein
MPVIHKLQRVLSRAVTKLLKPQVPCARLHTERGHINYFVSQFPSEQLIIRTLEVNLLPSSSHNSCTQVADRIVTEKNSARSRI